MPLYVAIYSQIKNNVVYYKQMDLIGGISRSTYSMVEIGERPASLRLLDIVSELEHVSYDYLFGVVDSRVNIHEPQYHQLIEKWSVATDRQKELILQCASRIVIKEEKNANR